MKHISVLIKPTSSACNIRCSYCFYTDISSHRQFPVFKKMSLETAEMAIKNIYADLDNGDFLHVAFQGGEPTLIGLPFFKHFITTISSQKKNVTVDYAIQTNGLLIDKDWCEFLTKNQFLVGLSLDCHPTIHNLYRVDNKGNGTFHRVMKTKELFDVYQIKYNILCVLTPELSNEPHLVFQFLEQNKIQYVQFIPCLDSLQSTNTQSFALSPEEFSDFYLMIFEDWLNHLSKGKYISIKLFDDIYHLLIHQQITACGISGNCQIQYVIESDGSVYPCDFYALDQYRLGYIQENTLRELFEKGIATQFLCEKQNSPQALCVRCPFKNICNGGCKRMSDTIYLSKEKNFCGYQAILNAVIPHLDKIAQLSKIATFS